MWRHFRSDKHTSNEQFPPRTATFSSTSGELSDKGLHDVYHTAFILRQKLVPDVVGLILDYADCFVKQSCGYRFEPEMSVYEFESPRKVAESPAVRCNARTRQPVRMVSFEVESHDQGWADSTNGGSWTWFAAEVLHGDHTEHGGRGDARKDVVRNHVADGIFTLHRVDWRADGDDDEAAQWVRNLCPGDRIILLALAQFGGWVNYVKSVRITIYTRAVL